MNKITRGSLAIGCGLLLTLGSAGSIAYWQTEASTGAAAFFTGDIDLQPRETVWLVDGVEVDIDALPNTPIVPGSVIEWEQVYRLDQNGSGLHLQLHVDSGAITPADEVASPLTITRGEPISASESSVALVPVSGTADTYTATGKGDFSITTTFTWPFGNTADATGAFEELGLDLGASTLTLTQVAAPADEEN